MAPPKQSDDLLGRIAFGAIAVGVLAGMIYLVVSREAPPDSGAAIGAGGDNKVAALLSDRPGRFPIHAEPPSEPVPATPPAPAPAHEDEDIAAGERYGKTDALEASGRYRPTAAAQEVLGIWRFEGTGKDERSAPAEQPRRAGKKAQSLPDDAFGGGSTAELDPTLTAPAPYSAGVLWTGRALPEGPPAGKLVINVIPWGEVYVDGQAMGYPPVIAEGLSAGKHLIRIQRPGFASKEEQVVLRPGADQHVHVRFKRVGEE